MTFDHQELNALTSNEPWTIQRSGYPGPNALTEETVLGLTNGYVGVRGTIEEGAPLELPGTFYAGVYDRSDAPTKNLVNAPNWVGLRFFSEGQGLDPVTATVVEFSRLLDMGNGLLMRRTIYRDTEERETLLEGYRFLSMADPHVAGVVMIVRPLNWAGRLRVESVINIDVTNLSEPTEPLPPPEGLGDQKRTNHLDIVETGFLDDSDVPYVEVITRDNGTRIGTAAVLRASRLSSVEHCPVQRSVTTNNKQCLERLELEVARGTSYQIEKFVGSRTSNDLPGVSDSIRAQACRPQQVVAAASVKASVGGSIKRSLDAGMPALLTDHRSALTSRWEKANIAIEGDDRADKALRYNVFQLICCYSGSNPEVSIGAKALGGEGYRGQVFWDTEAYLLPFYSFTNPDAAKSLLLYRYRRLDAARENAASSGYGGARFPWNSADTGKEESSASFDTNADGNLINWHADSMVHVVGAVAYGVEQYVRATADMGFLMECGAEMLIETARFWVSRAEYNENRRVYELRNVVGPDEYHLFVDNDFYTNALARWNIRRAIAVLNEIRACAPDAHKCLLERLGVTDEEKDTWYEVANGMYVPIDKTTGLAEQFDGYFSLRDLTIQEHDENNMPRWPQDLDIRHLKDTQIIKQADVIMAMYLLSNDFDQKTKRVNYEYYLRRTMHKSTLSASIYAIVALSLGEETDAYDHFVRTAEADLVDSQGNTWQGPHIASAGGTWQAAIFGFAGLRVEADGVLAIEPHLPNHWKAISFYIAWRGALLRVVVSGDQVEVSPASNNAGPESIVVRIFGEDVRIQGA